RHKTVPEQPCRDNPALVPISLARTMQQETKHELRKTEEQQEMRNAMLEQMVTETANQLNEQVRSCGRTPTTHWLGAIGEIAWTVQAEQDKVKAECSSCTFDINVQMGELLQCCEKLQEQVDSLETRQMAMGKLKKMSNWGQKDQKRLQNMEATVVQMQGDCEKFSFVSDTLQKDSQEKQKAIEV
ncbi:QRIC2 protein, partial [Cinclus mexicanus]|nr:QRIC2 protein [Cinclus mexicanus]